MKACRRVDIIASGMNFGGAEKQVLMLGTGLRKRGWDVRIISLIDAPNRPDANGVEIVSLHLDKGAGKVTALLGLVRQLRSDRPDVVVTFMYHANVLGRLAARIARVATVVSSIRNEFFGGRMRDMLERLTEPLANVTVTNSSRVAEALLKRRIVAAERLRVVPNGVGLRPNVMGEDRDAVRVSLGLAQSDFLWLAVGRLEPQKDYPNLIRAAQILSRNHPNARIFIAGSGRMEKELKTIIQDAGVSSVQLLGFRSDVQDLLCAADALVLSSAWEGSPNAVLEAMASGKVVVATNVGGVSDLVDDGVNGLLVEPGQPELLASAMEQLMNTGPDRRQAMGDDARRKIAAGWSEDAVCDLWNDLLTGQSIRGLDPSR